MDQSTSFPRCPGCQQPLAPGRAQGLCPRCLLARAAFVTEPEASAPTASVPELAAVAAAFPQLEVLELIGRGGMGVVYRARQKSLNRLVALKLLAPGRERDPAFAERFAREARALAALNHPNIVTVHDFGFAASPAAGGAGGFYFLLMEFVDGVNLRQAMQAGRFTSEQALAIVPPVCAALQFAHERGIVHRDIKPENLLLDKDGRIKIADFGIAKMLGAPVSGPAEWNAEQRSAGEPTPDLAEQCSALRDEPTQATAAGTPHYMAPEQRDATGRADHRADIYSLGVVLYELLTGELPGARLEPPSHKVQIDVRLDEIVLRALAVQPELRYATAAEFRTQVDTVAGQLGQTSRPQPVADRVPRLLRTSGGLLHTPEQLATFAGQFCVWQQRGQLVLDEQRLTFSRDGRQTVIPLAAIREVSLAEYPRTMNSAGVDVLRVSYEDAGHTQQVFLAPMDGWFAWPSTWNARVADWHAAIRNAVAQVTGREPALTPREQVGVPAGDAGLKAFLLAAYALPMLAVFLVLRLAQGGPGRGSSMSPILFLGLMLLGGFFGQRLVWWLIQRPRPSRPAISPWSRVVGGLLLLGALAFGAGWLANRNALARAATQETVVKLQVATAQEAGFQAAVNEFTARTANPRDEAQRHRDQIEGNRLQGELASATRRRQELERTLAQGTPQPDRLGPLLLGLAPFLLGLWLLLRTGTVTPPEAKPRRWMQWLGVACLALGLPLAGFGSWIAYQIAQDSSWNPAPAEAFTTFAVGLGSVVLVGGGLALLAYARPGRRTGTIVAAIVAVLLLGGLFVASRRPMANGWLERTRPSAVGLALEPVSVDDNVVMVNLHTTVTGAPVELRVGFSGPPVAPEILGQLTGRYSHLPVTLVRSGLPSGNRPWQLQALASNLWQVGFVFPSAAAAEETFRGLQKGELGEFDAGTWDLFETIASDGQRYRGELSVGAPVNGSDAKWMSVTGTSTRGRSTLVLNWEVAAGSTGLLHGIFGTETRTVPLNVPYRTQGNALRVELTQLDDERVRLRTSLLGSSSTQELTGNFDELADALLGSACFSAKGVRGQEFQLCHFNGQPFTVQLLQGPAAGAAQPKLAIAPLLVLLVLGLGALTVIVVTLVVRRRFGGAIAVVLLLVFGVAVGGVILSTVPYARAGRQTSAAAPAVVPSETRR